MRRSLVITCLLASSVLAVVAATHPEGLFHPPMPSPPRQDEVSLVLKSPGLHLKLGVPDFVVTGNDPATRTAADTIAKVLWADLDFEREYYLIAREASAMLPVTRADALPINEWAELGADLVVAGEARPIDRDLALDLRIVWTTGDSPGQSLFERAYTCGLATPRGARDCAHRIADDVHRATRALAGVAQTRIAFVSDRDHGRIADSTTIAPAKEVYVADYDGANPVRVTTARSTTCCANWSPLRTLAYVSWQAGWPDIYLLNLANPGHTMPRPWASKAWVNNWSPAWSPDGTRLAFASNRSGNIDVWVVNADGSGLMNLTNHRSADGAPTWSPDGTQIAFTSDRTGTNALYVMSAEGSAPRVIVREQVDRPSWSSANVIAFTLATDARHKDIGLYDVPTGRFSVLTDGQYEDQHPSMSPNGRHIAFETNRFGGRQIAVMDRTGANIHPVTTSGENTYPSWEQWPATR
jgi:TolB protein